MKKILSALIIDKHKKLVVQELLKIDNVLNYVRGL